MKLVNKSDKIICMDGCILMPDNEMPITDKETLAPSLKVMVEKGWLHVDDTEEQAAQHEAEVKAAAEKAAAEKEAEIKAAVEKAKAEKEAEMKAEAKKAAADKKTAKTTDTANADK